MFRTAITLLIVLGTAVPRADAQPGFGARTDFAVGNTPRQLAIADLDEDGHQDLLVACEAESFISILLGNGDGTFAARTELATDFGPRALAVVDWNGDGDLDVLSYSSGGTRLSSYLGQGDGTFVAGPWAELGTAISRIVPADLDGDGILDVAASGDGAGTAPRLVTLRGAGGGAFGARGDFDSGSSRAYDLVVGQFNGTGAADVFLPLACTCPSHLLPGLGNPAAGPAYGPAASLLGTARLREAVAADLDADGKLDLVATDAGAGGVQPNGGVRVLRSLGGGAFDVGPMIGTGRATEAIALAPWGGPTETDVVVANAGFSTVSVVRILCDAVVGQVISAPVGGTPVDVAVADLNEDGVADIVSANQGPGTVTIRLMTANATPYACNPLASVSPSSLAYGGFPAGSTSTRNVVVKNVGAVSFDVTSVTKSGSFQFNATHPALPGHLAPGQTFTIAVTYTAGGPGDVTGLLMIATTDPLHPTFLVELSASGLPISPVLQLDPGNLDFGAGYVGEAETMIETVSNVGSATLTITNVTMEDPEFVYLGPAPPITLAPGFAVGLQVRYQRLHRGAAVGTLHVSSTDPQNPEVAVPISGETLQPAPRVGLDVSSVDFGTAFVGAVEDAPVVVMNIGVAPLHVSAVTVTGGPEFSLVGSPGPFVIAPGASTTRTVRYARLAAGSATGTFHVASDDSLTPEVAIPLAGSAQPAPSIVASAPSRPTLAVGASTVVPVVVRNLGPGALTFTPGAIGSDLVETSPYDGPILPLPQVRIDPGGGSWDVIGNGSIGTGTTGEFNGAMRMAGFPPLASTALGVEGQELRVGPAAIPGGLLATRKVYVPSDGNFARYANVIENPTDSPIPTTVDLVDSIAIFPDGSAASSSGNGSFTIDDDWVAFPTDGAPGRRSPARVSATVGAAHRPSTSSYAQTFTGIGVRVRYNVTVEPHGRLVVLGWILQGETFASAQADAASLASAPPLAFKGLSAIDRAAAWNAPAGPAVFRTAGLPVSLASGDSIVVDLVCDAAAATLPATIEGTLRIASNDPLHPVLSVPVGFDITGGEVVGVPPPHATDARLELAGLVPNPASRGGALRVAYSLASDAPATLTAYDVRGRVVARREIAAPQPGPASLALTGRLPAGVVWLRLEQAGQRVTQKAIVLP